MTKIFVKPAKEGLKVPLPENGRQYLPEKGMNIPLNQYWARRLRDNEVVKCARPPKPTPSGNKKATDDKSNKK